MFILLCSHHQDFIVIRYFPLLAFLSQSSSGWNHSKGCCLLETPGSLMRCLGTGPWARDCEWPSWQKQGIIFLPGQIFSMTRQTHHMFCTCFVRWSVVVFWAGRPWMASKTLREPSLRQDLGEMIQKRGLMPKGLFCGQKKCGRINTERGLGSRLQIHPDYPNVFIT